MKITKIQGILAASVLIGAGTLASCSSNELEYTGSDKDLDAAFISLDLAMLNGSRSTTTTGGGTSSGTEEAFPNESKIQTLQLIFCNAGSNADGDSFLMAIDQLEEVKQSNENGKIVNTVKVPVDYKEYYNKLMGKKVVVYAVANATVNTTQAPKDWKIQFNDLKSNGLGEFSSAEGNVVPLANAQRSAVLDYTSFDIKHMKDLFAGEGRVYHLSDAASGKPNVGTVTMERVVARLDYKGNDTGNIYPLGETGIYIKVDKLQPVNVSKEAYVLRHTSAGGNSEASVNGGKLFGNEKGTTDGVYNWIYDTDWATKAATNGAPSANYFHNQPVDNSGAYTLTGSWTDVDNLTGNTTNSDKYGDKKYHVWHYVSENTLPSVSKMIEGLSTGVAFRAVLCDAQGKAYTKAELLDKNAPWAWNLTFSESNGGLDVSDLKSGTRHLVKSDNQDAYALVYYYWNRHNDETANLAKTEPMEFAVVRNHVYKISITKFNTLPREYNPLDADEVVDAKNKDFEVSMAVMPWGYTQVEMDI